MKWGANKVMGVCEGIGRAAETGLAQLFCSETASSPGRWGKPGLKPLTLDRQEDMSQPEGTVGDVRAHSKHRGKPLSDQPRHQQ